MKKNILLGALAIMIVSGSLVAGPKFDKAIKLDTKYGVAIESEATRQGRLKTLAGLLNAAATVLLLDSFAQEQPWIKKASQMSQAALESYSALASDKDNYTFLNGVIQEIRDELKQLDTPSDKLNKLNDFYQRVLGVTQADNFEWKTYGPNPIALPISVN